VKPAEWVSAKLFLVSEMPWENRHSRATDRLDRLALSYYQLVRYKSRCKGTATERVIRIDAQGRGAPSSARLGWGEG